MSVDDQDIAAGYGAHNLPCYVLESPTKVPIVSDRVPAAQSCWGERLMEIVGSSHRSSSVPQHAIIRRASLFRNHHIGVQWQMGAMLLDRSDRQAENGVLVQAFRNFRKRQFSKHAGRCCACQNAAVRFALSRGWRRSAFEECDRACAPHARLLPPGNVCYRN